MGSIAVILDLGYKCLKYKTLIPIFAPASIIEANFPGLNYYDSTFETLSGVIAQYRVKGKNAQGEGPYSSTVFVYVSCTTGGGELPE